MTNRTCTKCNETKEIDQFRLLKPGRPRWTPMRRSHCRACERKDARTRTYDKYHGNPEFRERQKINAAIQSRRQRGAMR